MRMCNIPLPPDKRMPTGLNAASGAPCITQSEYVKVLFLILSNLFCPSYSQWYKLHLWRLHGPFLGVLERLKPKSVQSKQSQTGLRWFKFLLWQSKTCHTGKRPWRGVQKPRDRSSELWRAMQFRITLESHCHSVPACLLTSMYSKFIHCIWSFSLALQYISPVCNRAPCIGHQIVQHLHASIGICLSKDQKLTWLSRIVSRWEETQLSEITWGESCTYHFQGCLFHVTAGISKKLQNCMVFCLMTRWLTWHCHVRALALGFWAKLIVEAMTFPWQTKTTAKRMKHHEDSAAR